MATDAGVLSVLNCTAGDIRINFDKDDPLEVERAKRIIRDMLKRGYILFVEGAKGKLRKVKGFDAKSESYIVADGPLYSGESDAGSGTTETPQGESKKKAAGKTKKVPMRKTRATGIAPTAGG